MWMNILGKFFANHPANIYLMKNICIVLTLVLSPFVALSQAFTEDFESGSSGYTSSVTECISGSDYFSLTNDAGIPATFTGSTGNYFAAQDYDGCAGSSAPQTLTWSGISISGCTGLSLSIDVAEDDDGSNQDWDANSLLTIEVNIDGGGYVNILQFAAVGGTNTEPAQDTNFDGTGDAPALTDTWQTFTGAIAGTGTSLDLRITFAGLTAGDEDVAIDNIVINGTGCGVPSCTPPTVTSIVPASGPVGTTVIINGTGFTAGTTVDFNGTSASSVTVLSATQLEVVVPAGASSGDVDVTDNQPCTQTYSSFTVVDTDNSGCGTVYTDLFISEVYDAGSGDVYYYEIYNGTGAAVTLTGVYSIGQDNNGGGINFTTPLTGSIPDGGTFVLGNNASHCSGAQDQAGHASGINDNDGIFLIKSGTNIDRWNNAGTVLSVGGTGYTYRRKTAPVNTPPSMTWNETGDWDINGTESCSDLGTYTVGGTPLPSVTTHPSTSQLCQDATATLTAAATGATSFQWYVNAPGSSTWTAISAPGTPVYGGFTSNTLTIGNLTGLDGYQYYCEITSAASCWQATNAVMLDVLGNGGTPGLWVGGTSTDWCDCRNWDDAKVPIATTDVTINQTASNDCIVGTTCAAVCNDLSLSTTGAARSLTINGTGALDINGNAVIDGAAAGTSGADLVFTTTGATFNIDGNLTIETGGTLDMSANSPTLTLGGNWTNNDNQANGFLEGAGSTVSFNGAGIQDINTNNFTENFGNVTLNKSANYVRLQDDIALDAAGILALSDDQIDLNGSELTINNSAIGAITRTSGSIVDESGAAAGNNDGKIHWTVNTVGGIHEFPFASAIGGTYIPFRFIRTAGNAGVVSLSTYGTPATNLPWPNTPDLVNNLASTQGLTPDNRDATADRFWQIDVTGTPTATCRFSYTTAELPTVAPYNDHTTMVAQRYQIAPIHQWDPTVYPGQTQGTITGGFYVERTGITTFSPWALANINSVLPTELLNFDAEKVNEHVHVSWSTASEVNNDYFVVERSNDAQNFEPIGYLNGAGTSVSTINYDFIDDTPLSGISYYRLTQVDFDGSTMIYGPKMVEFNEDEAGFALNSAYTFEDELNISVNNPDKTAYNIFILDTKGRQVLEHKSSNDREVIDISDVSTGIYFVKLVSGNRISTKKLFIK